MSDQKSPYNPEHPFSHPGINLVEALPDGWGVSIDNVVLEQLDVPAYDENFGKGNWSVYLHEADNASATAADIQFDIIVPTEMHSDEIAEVNDMELIKGSRITKNGIAVLTLIKGGKK